MVVAAAARPRAARLVRVSSSGGTVPPPRDIGSYAQLKALSDEELERRLDGTLGGGTALHTNFYREEIARRESERSSRKMVELTEQIRLLTLAVTAATIVALALSVIALMKP